MTAAKVWQILIGAVCVVCLLLSQGSVVSQTDYGIIYSIAWRPDGMQVATGHSSGTIRLWDVTTGELLNTFGAPNLNTAFPPEIGDVDWHRSGTSLAVTATVIERPISYLWVLDATSGEIVHDLGSPGWIHDSAWSPDGTMLASAYIDTYFNDLGELDEANKIDIWDVETEQLVAVLEADRVLFTLAWSPDGSRLASAGWSRTIIWDTQTWTPLIRIGEPPETPTPLWVSWSPDSTRVVTPGMDGLAHIWDATTGSLLMTLQSGDVDPLEQVEWQPEGSLLVGRNDTALIFWDAATGQQTQRKSTPERLIHVAWSPGGTQLAYGDEHGMLQTFPVSAYDNTPSSPERR